MIKSERDKSKGCACKKLILMCEADPLSAELQKTMLKQKFGLHAEMANTGLEAFEKFIENRAKTCCELKYKLVIMDINLPNDEAFTISKQMLEH